MFWVSVFSFLAIGAQAYDVAFSFCGGFAGFTCDRADPPLTCVDDPLDLCDPLLGGADCGGICVNECRADTDCRDDMSFCNTYGFCDFPPCAPIRPQACTPGRSGQCAPGLTCSRDGQCVGAIECTASCVDNVRDNCEGDECPRLCRPCPMASCMRPEKNCRWEPTTPTYLPDGCLQPSCGDYVCDATASTTTIGPKTMTPRPSCPAVTCELDKPECLDGYARNSEGCQLCRCLCPAIRCMIPCPFGIAPDSDGCLRCTCREPTSCRTTGDCGVCTEEEQCQELCLDDVRDSCDPITSEFCPKICLKCDLPMICPALSAPVDGINCREVMPPPSFLPSGCPSPSCPTLQCDFPSTTTTPLPPTTTSTTTAMDIAATTSTSTTTSTTTPMDIAITVTPTSTSTSTATTSTTTAMDIALTTEPTTSTTTTPPPPTTTTTTTEAPLLCEQGRCEQSCSLHGYRLDERGCQTCGCDCSDTTACENTCVHGSITDPDGCETCYCKKPERPCNQDSDCGRCERCVADGCLPQPGKTFPDKCNTCTCLPIADNSDELEAVCTEKGCLEPPLTAPCQPGTTVLAPDGCNTCSCTKEGKSVCTEAMCYPASESQQQCKQQQQPVCLENCFYGFERDEEDCPVCKCKTETSVCSLVRCGRPICNDPELSVQFGCCQVCQNPAAENPLCSEQELLLRAGAIPANGQALFFTLPSPCSTAGITDKLDGLITSVLLDAQAPVAVQVAGTCCKDMSLTALLILFATTTDPEDTQTLSLAVKNLEDAMGSPLASLRSEMMVAPGRITATTEKVSLDQNPTAEASNMMPYHQQGMKDATVVAVVCGVFGGLCLIALCVLAFVFWGSKQTAPIGPDQGLGESPFAMPDSEAPDMAPSSNDFASEAPRPATAGGEESFALHSDGGSAAQPLV
eukprot:gb/GEZN01000476.1/.p1 GENE.gb/GEZN01000476.1/~~gb/GEZN01000476.1/.p1  ORF type:complete len:914 (-),score=141.17 gb/GEZN01000476.1/:593-3334(-)